MLRAVVIFVLLAALAAAGAWFADHPGIVAVDWRGYRIETSVAVLGLAVLVLVALAIVLHGLWRWLLTGPSSYGAWRREGKRRRGYEALSRGLVAVAAGDAGEAKKLAKRTAVLLNDPPLTLLLSAQAAQLDGDEAGAQAHFEAMCERPETEFLGLRGLLVQARRRGDDAEALRLARRAYELRPDTPWVVQELFGLEAGSGHWVEARAVSDRAAKQKLIGEDEGRRRRGLSLFGEAQAAEARGESKQALALARKAHEWLPDFVPATALLARLQIAAGDNRRARRLLQDAWRRQPHPQLAPVWLAMTPDADAAARLKALDKLVVGAPEHAESRLALAAAALEAHEAERAGALLQPFVDDPASAGRRACRLVAEWLEMAHGDAAAAGTWLRRAAALPEDEAWVCGVCGHHGLEWSALCPDCGSFDAIDWRPPAGASTLPVEAIVAAPELLPPQQSESAAEPTKPPPHDVGQATIEAEPIIANAEAEAGAEVDAVPHEKRRVSAIAPTATEG